MEDAIAEALPLLGVAVSGALVMGLAMFILPWGARKIKQGLEASEKRQYQNWNKKYGGKFNK